MTTAQEVFDVAGSNGGVRMFEDILEIFPSSGVPEMEVGDRFMFGTYLAGGALLIPLVLVMAWVTWELAASWWMNRLRNASSFVTRATHVVNQ